VSELKTKKKAPRKYTNKKRRKGVALSLPSPSARPSWAGSLTQLPAKLQKFLPLLQPQLERMQRGEILKTFISLPTIGTLILEKDSAGDDIKATFVDCLEVAKWLLTQLRQARLATRYGTGVKSPQGGCWVSLPRQRILPIDLEVLMPSTDIVLNLLERSILWVDIAKTLDAFGKEPPKVVKPTSHWLTPSILRAVRAPTFALPCGGALAVVSVLTPPESTAENGSAYPNR